MTLRIIAGKFKGHRLKTPGGLLTRPTQGVVREAIFNICQDRVHNARFLDLFAGSGAMGFEALSRGALHVTLIENHRSAIACIKQNITSLHAASQVTLLATSARIALEKVGSIFDLVYIDPPYDLVTDELLAILLTRQLLAPSALLFVEERYIPKKPPTPFHSLQLMHKNSRRFGATLLHEYQKSEVL